MDTNSTFDTYLHLMLERASANARANLSRLHSTHSLREIVELRHVDMAAAVRPVARSLPVMRQLIQEAQRRAGELVDAQLRDLGQRSGEDLQRRIHYLRQNEWRYLPGNFPALAQQVERTSRALQQERR